MNKPTIANVSEIATMLEYAKRGYTINLPTTPSRYDFIAEKDGRTVKVQVKHGSRHNNNTELLGFSKTPYKRNDIDVVCMYDSVSDNVYYVPSDHVEDMNSIRLRLTPYLYDIKEAKALIAEHYTKFIG